jgi:histidine triad (HIT) family protein
MAKLDAYRRGDCFGMEKDCIFCQIARGKTDTQMLHQTDTLVVFKDINPHAPVHLLLVPKKHIRSVNDLTDADQEILAELILVAKEMAKEQGVDKSGYKLLYNVEKGGGQLIFHLHLHLLGGRF